MLKCCHRWNHFWYRWKQWVWLHLAAFMGHFGNNSGLLVDFSRSWMLLRVKSYIYGVLVCGQTGWHSFSQVLQSQVTTPHSYNNLATGWYRESTLPSYRVNTEDPHRLILTIGTRRSNKWASFWLSQWTTCLYSFPNSIVTAHCYHVCRWKQFGRVWRERDTSKYAVGIVDRWSWSVW